MGAGREFQFLEVIGTNVLANEVVRHFFNLTAKECWESAKRLLRANHALGGIIDFNSSEHLPSNWVNSVRLVLSISLNCKFVFFFNYLIMLDFLDKN